MRAASTSMPLPSASWPNTRIEPDVTRTSPVTELISVVLPAPLGPSRPKKAPSGIVRSSASSASVPSS